MNFICKRFGRISGTKNLLCFWLALAVLATGHAMGDTTWLGGVANWTPGIWNNGVPNTSSIAVIENGGNALLPVGVSGTYNYLVLGGAPGHTGSISISGGFLTGPQTTLGFYSGGSGTATISSGTWVNSGLFGIGYQGRGTVNVSGGLLQGNVLFGDTSTAVGQGTITGGLWNAPDYFVVGGHGLGSVQLVGGTIASAIVDVGNETGGRGALTIASGTVSATNSVNIGQYGTGTMTMNGGNVSTGAVSLGYASSGRGTLQMAGGQLTIGGAFYVGNLGMGTLTLNGGRIDSGSVWVARGSALVNGGTMVISGTTSGLDVGSTANPTLTVTAGIIQTNLVRLGGGSGIINVNGGTLSAGDIHVGELGTGTFNLTKGLVVATGGVTLGVNAADSGALTLSGSSLVGELQTTQVIRGLGRGTVTFNGGVLVATADQNLLSGFAAGDVKINAGGAIIHSNGHDTAVLAQLSGVGALTQAGAGSLTLSGSNTFTGGVIVNGGVIHMLNANALGASTNSLQIEFGGVDLGGFTVTVGNLNGTTNSVIGSSVATTSTLVTNGSGTSNFQGFIQDNNLIPGGTVALRKTGAGTLTLSGSNNYSGGTTLSAGTLNLGNESALGTGGLFIQGVSTIDNTSGAALALITNNSQAWNANFTFKGSSSLDLGSGAVFMGASRSIAVNSSTLTVGGPISGATAATGLTKTGTGTLVLLGDNDYIGATTISAGTLQLGNGGTSGSLAGTSLVNSGILIVDRSTDSGLSNLISGTGKLVKNGAGNLFLNGANTYTGGTILNGGGLVLANAKALGAVTGDLTANGGTLDLDDNSVTVGLLSGTGGTILNSGPGAAKLTTNSAKSGTFAGVLADGSGGGTVALEKAGAGILTLNGMNLHTGGTILSGGGLNLGSANALGNGGLTISGAVTLDNTSGAPLMLPNTVFENWNANFTFKGSNDLNLGAGNVMMSATRTVNVASHTLFVDGSILGATPTVGLIKTGTGTLTLRGTSSYGGSTTVSAGVLDLEGGTLGAGAILNSGTVILNHSSDLTMSNAMSGAGLYVKRGAGLLTLTGTNTYTGGTRLEEGGIVLGNARALGAATGDLTMGSASLDLHGNNVTIGLLSGTGGSIINTVAGLAKLTSNSTKSGTYAGGFFDGSGVAKVAFEKAGTGVLTLSGSSNFSGGTTLSAGGLNLANANALGTGGAFSITGATTLDNTSGAALVLAGNNAQNWNSNFTFKGSNDLDLGTGNVMMSAARTVTVASHTLTVGGNISGATATTGLTKTGTGTLVLTGSNTYAGATTISTGILQLGNGGTSGSLANGAVVNSGTFIANRSDNFALVNLISGAGKFVKNGAGELVLAATNTYTGGTTLNSGTLTLANAKGLGAATGDLTINGGSLNLLNNTVTVGLLSGAAGNVTTSGTAGTLITNSTKSGTFAGTITGDGVALTKMGTGTLTLSSHNSFTGGVNLAGGGLNLGNAGALGSGTLTISAVSTLDNSTGAALTLSQSNAQRWNADFSFKGSNDLDLGPGSVLLSATRNVTVASHTLTVGGNISGATATTGLTKSGTGTLILTGSNTYGGTTTISQGTLQLGNGGTSGSLELGAIVNSGTFAIDRSDDLALAGSISGAGRLVKNGAGTLMLYGVNSYTGGTFLNAGKLVAGTDKALGTGSDLTMGNATLDLNGRAVTIGLLTGSGTLTNSFGVGVLTTISTKSGTYSGQITEASGNPLVFEKGGTGTLTLTGSNNFSGGFRLTGGGLNIGNAFALGTNTFTIAGASTLDNTTGASLTLGMYLSQTWNADFTFKGSSDLDLGPGAVIMNATRTVNVASHTLTAGGIFGSTAGLTKTGTGTLILKGDNGYNGTTTISAGILQLGNGGTSGSLSGGAIVNSGTFVVNRSDVSSLPNLISGAGKFVKDGAGALTLSAANTYSGGTTLNNGKLILGNAKALGAATGNLLLNSGTLEMNGFSATVGLLTGGTASGINNASGTNAKLTTNSSASDTFAGSLLPGLLTLEKAGTGTLTLSGSNAHQGGTILSGGGLNLANANALGIGAFTISGVATIDNTMGTALSLATNNTQNWNANFTFKGSNDLDLGTGDVAMNASRTVTVTSHSLTVGGVISGATAATGLTKSGTGTLVLANNNTYTGVTTISAGTLQVGNGGTTGSLASSSVVNSGVLAFKRSDALSYGGVISGRGSVLKDSAGSLTLTGNSTYTGGTELRDGELHVGSSKALGTGNVTLKGGLLATNGVQKQINVGGNLFWDSNAKIELSLAGPTTSETLNIAGSLGRVSMLDSGTLTFVFNDAGFAPNTPVAVLTATRGFGSLTAANFGFESEDVGLAGTFYIQQNTLYFTNGMPLGPMSADSSSTSASGFSLNLGGTSLSGGSLVLTSGNFLTSGNLYTGATTFDGVLFNGGSLVANSLAWNGGQLSTMNVVPEPSTWALLFLGAIFLVRPALARLRGCFR